ncbi:MAG: hypothetical protein CL608_17290 [Anaerolineaceae bacterium]|nr:hypothetical protein [Anaerolineaceae bacterium]
MDKLWKSETLYFIMCGESYTRLDRGSSIFFVNAPGPIQQAGDCMAKSVKLISFLGKPIIIRLIRKLYLWEYFI